MCDNRRLRRSKRKDEGTEIHWYENAGIIKSKTMINEHFANEVVKYDFFYFIKLLCNFVTNMIDCPHLCPHLPQQY